MDNDFCLNLALTIFKEFKSFSSCHIQQLYLTSWEWMKNIQLLNG